MRKDSNLLLAIRLKTMKRKAAKTTTLTAQVAVTKMESGMDHVQVLPDDPRVGQVEAFRGLGYGQMLSTGSFEFTRHKIVRSQAITELKLPHSSISRCKDHTRRFTFIVQETDLENFSCWLMEEAPQAAAYVQKFGDGHKEARPVTNREEYLALRNGGEQRDFVRRIRAGEEQLKRRLVQMNYSCLPNEDGSLKGATRMTTTVGMDIDHIPAEELTSVRERILAKKDELGLLMLELSARAAGYHLVFRRRPELSQVENLEWASRLLEVEFDKGAKDLTRVFFTTTGSPEDLIFLDDAIFEMEEGETCTGQSPSAARSTEGTVPEAPPPSTFPMEYHGIPFEKILKKYWELNNNGFEPTEGDRDTLTFQLASDLRHICGKSFEWLDQGIPCYDGVPLEEKRACSTPFNPHPSTLPQATHRLSTFNLRPSSHRRCRRGCLS